jgi:hypothetical protein
VQHSEPTITQNLQKFDNRNIFQGMAVLASMDPPQAKDRLEGSVEKHVATI